MRVRRAWRKAVPAIAGVALIGGAILSPAGALPARPQIEPASKADILAFVPYRGSQTTTVIVDGKRYTTPIPHTIHAFGGHFSGVDDGNVVLYTDSADWSWIGRQGGPDAILRIRRTPDGVSMTTRSINASGNYETFVGDFDGNGIDDIFWFEDSCDYADSQPSYLWTFRTDGSHRSRQILGLPRCGAARHLVIDANRDGIDDIVWSAGDSVDHLWLMHPDGSHSTRATPKTAGEPWYDRVGRFGTEAGGGPGERRIVQTPAGKPEQLWIYDAHATRTVKNLPDLGGDPDDYNYTERESFVGHFSAGRADSVLFYDPRAPEMAEILWDFDDDGTAHARAIPQVGRSYQPLVGDFDGNGFDDVFWYSRTQTSVLWSNDGLTFTSSAPAGIPHDAMPMSVPAA